MLYAGHHHVQLQLHIASGDLVRDELASICPQEKTESIGGIPIKNCTSPFYNATAPSIPNLNISQGGDNLEPGSATMTTPRLHDVYFSTLGLKDRAQRRKKYNKCMRRTDTGLKKT